MVNALKSWNDANTKKANVLKISQCVGAIDRKEDSVVQPSKSRGQSGALTHMINSLLRLLAISVFCTLLDRHEMS